MLKKLKFLKDQRGLTLIELLVVVVILGIIGAIAVVAIGNVISNSKRDAHIANAEQMLNAARLAVAQESTATENWTMAELVTEGYLETAPQSPGDSGPYDQAASLVAVTNTDGVVSYTVTLVGDSSFVYIAPTAPDGFDRDDVNLD